MPPAKEIKYFNEQQWGLAEAGWPARLLGRHWLYQANRRFLWGQLRAVGGCLRRGGGLRLAPLAWAWRFVFGRRSDRWYRDLFAAYGGIGDISPKYCELSPREIESIDRRFPGLRVLLFIRDPIERDWSSARMNLCAHTGRAPAEVGLEEWLAYLERPSVARQSSYSNIIDEWSQVYGPRFHAFFFDDIREAPGLLLEAILGFLDASPTPTDGSARSAAGTRVGGGVAAAMPPAVHTLLVRRHEAEIRRLAARFPDSPWPGRWAREHAIE